MADWTFLTNHAHVLLCIASDPESLFREIAARVGITESATQRIVADLVEGGYVSKEKRGRRNVYSVHPEMHLRHPIEQNAEISYLLALLKT